MTRATYSLTGIEGPLFFDNDGQLTFLEKEGIDYAPTTVQVSFCCILAVHSIHALNTLFCNDSSRVASACPSSSP